MKHGMKVVKLTDDYVFKDFDCGNPDLNDFLLNDSKGYLKRLLSVTYLIENEYDIVAFFSVSNDKIGIPDSDKATWRKIKSLFPHSKHRGDYPAVKIGRFGVSLKYQHSMIGSDILNFVKIMFSTGNRSGCAFVTVDALKEAVPFYQKNGFLFLDKTKDTDVNNETCLMYFDLSRLL